METEEEKEKVVEDVKKTSEDVTVDGEKKDQTSENAIAEG